MEASLEHEDLLIKLRAKLNEEKVKLWEAPFISDGGGISQSVKELATKYAASLNIDEDLVTEGLHELQLHSIEKFKANEEYKETGCATIQVRATLSGEKARVVKITKQLSISGEDLIESVAELLGVAKNRLKLIYHGKLIKHTQSLQEQGIKNGAQVMALVMAEAPEKVVKEDKIYMEMKSTLDDATLLSEYVDDIGDDDEYMKLEDQSGKAVNLPPAERRALLVGLALHERGRAAAIKKDYSLALVLLLESDRQLNECRSGILASVDNVAVLQLDIAWCYLCLRSLAAAGDAAARLARAEAAFVATYGADHHRLIALKGTNGYGFPLTPDRKGHVLGQPIITKNKRENVKLLHACAANERVLFMRLYLLQGIVAFHRNKRAEARTLLEKAEAELKYLKVDENSVQALMELGWTPGQATTGLRATAGDLDRAHHFLEERRKEREEAREKHKQESRSSALTAGVRRERRLLGACADGSAVQPQLVAALQGMGYAKRLAVAALRSANNSVAEAVRLIQEHPEQFMGRYMNISTLSSEDSLVEPDNNLLNELVAMGYPPEPARNALRLAGNQISGAVDLLAIAASQAFYYSNPSTSADPATKKKDAVLKRLRKRELALNRLRTAIRPEEDDYLSTPLTEEEQFLAQYKSLL
ncbi:jg24157 [Pararge aegeria aegeria]|uniref:Jg24157 protein n=3 Tax=Pararge aegeria TaxID=116150 RepID=A0A8S4S3E5_9NEOP|nr:jg24157 [Pararge aegeria aegeria]